MAFNFQTGRWMEPSNGVYWYPYEVQGDLLIELEAKVYLNKTAFEL